MCQLTILCSDPIHNQSEFLPLQTEYDLQATPSHTNTHSDEWAFNIVERVILTPIRYKFTYRVPLPIIVLLPVQDLFLSGHRQSDPPFGNVESQMGAPPFGGCKEQQALRGSSPDIQREVGPRDQEKKKHSLQHLCAGLETGKHELFYNFI